jgi:pimeloyl-ACP methyl ester carboxylesterase
MVRNSGGGAAKGRSAATMERLVRDGVTLCYRDQGRGDPPLLFVHGWCGDYTSFQPQLAYFSRDHRCVAVDLRGHGASDKPVQAYTMAGFAEDLAWLCGQLGVAQPVVIGHAMGGYIAMALVQRHPGLPCAVVLVDSAVVPTAALKPLVDQLVAGLKSPDYRRVAQAFIDGMFPPSADPALKQRVTTEMMQAPHQVMASAAEHLAAFAADEAEAAVAACRVPLLNLMSSAALRDSARLQALCPQVVTGQTVGAGHFHQLEVPEQVNAMIARFLAVSVPSPRAAVG